MEYSNGFHFNLCFPTLNLKTLYITRLFTFTSFSKSDGKRIASVNFMVTSPVLVMVILGLKFDEQIFIVSSPICTYFL